VTPAALASFEQGLRRRLGGARRIAVLGVGDELQRADRLGMLAARAIDGLRRPGVRVFLAGTVPESFTAPIRRYRPDAVLLVDAADMGASPGSVALLGAGRLRGAGLSTHALPLSVLVAYLEATTTARVTLVGIQPDLRAEGTTVTADERRGIDRFVACVAGHLDSTRGRRRVAGRTRSRESRSRRRR
jgi:hydrogenase 3 maturation protease